MRWQLPLFAVLVHGPSMSPVLRSGDALLVWRGGRVRAGDVVVGIDASGTVTCAPASAISARADLASDCSRRPTSARCLAPWRTIHLATRSPSPPSPPVMR